MLSSTGASYDAGTGVLTIVGTPAQAQAALQGVVFTPNADTQEIGTSATSGLSVTVADSNGESSTDSRASIQVNYADTGPTISGMGQTAAAGQSVDPLSNTSIIDPNFSAMTVTVTVAADAGGSKGTFSNAGTWTVSTAGPDLVYTQSFAAQTNIGAAVSTAIQGLAFSTATGNPPGAATVDFTVGTVDDAAMTASAVVPLTVNTPHVGPTGTAGPAQQTTDEQAANPFSVSSFSDPDTLALTLTVTIPNGASGTVGDFTNASARTRTVSGSDPPTRCRSQPSRMSALPRRQPCRRLFSNPRHTSPTQGPPPPTSSPCRFRTAWAARSWCLRP